MKKSNSCSVTKPYGVSTQLWQSSGSQHSPVAYERVNAVVARGEVPQLYLFTICDFLGVTVSPLHRYIGIGIGIYKYVECAITVQHRQKSHGSCNLTKDCLYLGLYLSLGFFFRGFTSSGLLLLAIRFC